MLNLYHYNETIGFGPVKQLLKMLDPEQLVFKQCFKEIKLLFPDFQPDDEKRMELSLTEGIDPDHQIRFALKDRITRRFHKIARFMAENFPAQEKISLSGSNWDDGSMAFLKILSQYLPDGSIGFTLNQTATIRPSFANETEQKISLLCSRIGVLQPGEADFLKKQAGKYIHCGDYWTALRILQILMTHLKDVADVYYMMGFCCTFFDRTVEAEAWYQKAIAAGDVHTKVKAHYVLAMLYARHHLLFTQRSLAMAEEHLETAYRLLQTATNEEVPSLEFARVFNRNGYALILFRKGLIHEAIQFLDEGIKKLQANPESDIHLHRTVLIYNKAQCLQALGKVSEAIGIYEHLLTLDPNFPEYHMEMARCLMETAQWKAAIASLETAYNLDPFVVETHSLFGYCYSQLEQQEKCLYFYQKAWELSSDNPGITYDYAFWLAESDNYQDCRKVLRKNLNHATDPSLFEDSFSLLAETYLHLERSPDQAIQVLRDAMLHFPESKKLAENIDIIQTEAITA